MSKKTYPRGVRSHIRIRKDLTGADLWARRIVNNLVEHQIPYAPDHDEKRYNFLVWADAMTVERILTVESALDVRRMHNWYLHIKGGPKAEIPFYVGGPHTWLIVWAPSKDWIDGIMNKTPISPDDFDEHRVATNAEVEVSTEEGYLQLHWSTQHIEGKRLWSEFDEYCEKGD